MVVQMGIRTGIQKESKRGSSRGLQIEGSNFCFVLTHSTLCHTIQGVIMLIISNHPSALHLSDFEITCNYSLNCTLLDPITITN